MAAKQKSYRSVSLTKKSCAQKIWSQTQTVPLTEDAVALTKKAVHRYFWWQAQIDSDTCGCHQKLLTALWMPLNLSKGSVYATGIFRGFGVCHRNSELATHVSANTHLPDTSDTGNESAEPVLRDPVLVVQIRDVSDLPKVTLILRHPFSVRKQEVSHSRRTTQRHQRCSSGERVGAGSPLTTIAGLSQRGGKP